MISAESKATRKEAIAQAARHVMARPDTEITEVIEKDEDQGIGLTDRFAAALAMFFGILAGLAIIFLFVFLASGKAFGGFLLLMGYKGYGFKITAAVICLFVLAAFVAPTKALRLFGYLMKPFNNAFDFLPWL